MRRAARALTVFLAGAVLATLSTPALSLDPLTLILLRMARDRLISAGVENVIDRFAASPRAPVTVQPPASTLPLGMDDTQLQRLIDEGFVHLSAAQRNEVYESVRRILLDPKNAYDAPAIIADLAMKASAVRQAHESLNNLSAARKQSIVTEARAAYEKMPPATREELAEVLRLRVVPMPADLTDMILAEFDRVRAQSAVPQTLAK